MTLSIIHKYHSSPAEQISKHCVAVLSFIGFSDHLYEHSMAVLLNHTNLPEDGNFRFFEWPRNTVLTCSQTFRRSFSSLAA